MAIYVDQVGYQVSEQKVALSTKPCNYQIIRAKDSKCVLDGVASEGITDEASGDTVYAIDFSELTEEGRYYVLAGDRDKSYTFSIGDELYHSVRQDASKCLYYQRCGVELEAEYAGEYVHPACHTDASIMLEDYLEHTEYPMEYDMSGGWHDAGDFGRYVSAGAVAVGHLLYAYDLFPESFKDSLNIPESGNGIPDILNECAVELTWMLKMQEADGGVHHKLTAFTHPDFIMPQDDHDPFLIFPVSSMATADYAAVMALASRIYRPFMPEMAETMLDAARLAAWWLSQHDYEEFANPEGCNTGEYDDEDDTDERLWAYAELCRSDKENYAKYEKELNRLGSSCRGKVDFGWTDVSGMASLTILSAEDVFPSSMQNHYRKVVLAEADRLHRLIATTGYRLAMEPQDFVWGSNMVVLNRGMLLVLASRICDEADKTIYLQDVKEQLHYLFGRNPMNTSYVTGYGEGAFRNPHARVTDQDGIDAPMPGWVSGGPFKTPCDEPAMKAIPKGTPPMKCYIDHVGSYSTNEITIYWNSPLIFVLAGIENH